MIFSPHCTVLMEDLHCGTRKSDNFDHYSTDLNDDNGSARTDKYR